MTDPLNVVRATAADVDELVPLFGAYRAFYNRTPDPAAERAYLLLRLQRDEAVVLLARAASPAGGTAAGFTLLYPTFASVRLRSAWILNDLFVAPEFRRSGVARALLSAAADVARATGAARLELRTQNSNAAAQRLYEAMGWKLDQQFRRYTLAL